MYQRAAVYFVLLMGVTASAQSISLSGTVKNKSGRPIAGATVRLAVKNLNTTTNSTGNYSIIQTSPVTPAPLLPGSEHISMEKGIVSIGMTAPALVRIELFDMRGNMVARMIDQPAGAGEYRFDVTRHALAANMMVIRAAIGRSGATFRYLPLHAGGGRAIVSSAAASSTGGGITSLQAVVDTLNVTAANYMSYTEPLSSLQGVKDITLDTITVSLPKFSFFVTSLKALQDLSKSQNGFGGDLRFGKTGQGAGLLGADSICQCIAERSMPGSKVKQWRAFLSVAKGPDGTQVNAIDRIGQGPWYDRLGRLLSNNITELLNTRPAGADAAIKNDLPNEDGIPNHQPDPNQPAVDNHHFVTGTGTNGQLYSSTATCEDWTSVTANRGPHCGFSWPRGGMWKTTFGGGGSSSHWISAVSAPGCGAGIELVQRGGASPGSTIIGGGGGYGGFYCFALNP
ncbi:MAG: carboxypeptidase regulatory-like domain-containing protein [Chitinispirillaceae bacterium]|nr:carboxypeptidase regulatory-like domain-containing protein [Chitinispirillaceae bacterium]